MGKLLFISCELRIDSESGECMDINEDLIEKYAVEEPYSLYFDFAPILDKDLEILSNYSHITELSLAGTKISNLGLIYLERLPNLQKLNIGLTQITDEGVKFLKKLKKLENIDLSYTKITDIALQYLQAFPQLTEIALRGTSITDEGVKYLETFLNLESSN